MQFFKRFGLFILVNMLIMVVITTVTSLLGLEPYMTSSGLNLESLAIFCLIWGMGGAFISLWMSRAMARWMMGVQVIDPQQARGGEADLVQMVHMLAKKAELPAMPQVGIYDSPEVNAFATGPSASRSMVAVSSGLLQSMDRGEVEGVLAHEVAHVANGDMVTMTLIQGILNAFVMFFARIVGYAVAQFFQGDEEESPSFWINFAVTMVFQILFGILASLVVNAFSRYREFRADIGGARLAGRGKMIAALERLQRQSGELEAAGAGSGEMAAFKISGGGMSGLAALFSTHPPLEDRIQRLRSQQS